jgi:7-carboxy-7-deazaguanine synthase
MNIIPTQKKMNISEIFVSIQGEGRYVGHPSIFIRTSGCNLRCRWGTSGCDTPYTSWFPESNPMTIESILTRIAELKSQHPHIKEIVVTGGEPLLQQHLHVLIDELKHLHFFLTVETNGTIRKPLKIDFVSISPKLKSSVPVGSEYEEMHEKSRCNKDAISYWMKHYSHQLKFVVNEQADECEIEDMLTELGINAPDHVFVMPQGVTREELSVNSRLCVDICLRHGWKFSPRAHIEIFGNIRGT